MGNLGKIKFSLYLFFKNFSCSLNSTFNDNFANFKLKMPFKILSSQPKTVEDLLKKRWSKKKWKRKSIGDGFFVEAGASDGEHISNSLYFELSHKVIESYWPLSYFK